MDQASKRRGRPLPDAINMKPIAFNLEEALAVETLYRPNLLVIQQDIKPWEVSLNSRDGAVQILRFLRIWFDVPQKVFFTAVTYLDLFLSRMKVQEKYLNCATISCFNLAVDKESINIDMNQLVTISQSKCSVSDMLRMSGIIKEKLKVETGNGRITTSADILMIYLDILECIDPLYREKFKIEELLTRLEVLLADNNCAFFRSSTLALCLLKIEIEQRMMTEAINCKSVILFGEFIHLLAKIRDIQLTCKIKNADLVNCSNNVSKILKQYDNQDRSKHSQNLMWRFSSSTLGKGKRRRNYHQPLDTIQEKAQYFNKKMRA